MHPSGTIGSKGQTTIPLEIRKRLGLSVGDRVEFVIEKNQIVIRRALRIDNPFEQYVGALPAFTSQRQVIRWVARLRGNA